MDSEVIRIVAEIKSNWLRLGTLIQRMSDSRAYEALGFPHMYAWMTARFRDSLSNVFSALRSVRALKGVPEETLKRIGERNAHMLTYMPEKERKSDEWLTKAATLPTKEFKQEVISEAELWQRCDFASSLAPGVTSRTGQIEVESMLEICARRLKATRCRVTFAALRPGGGYEKDATEDSICRFGSEFGGGIRPDGEDETDYRHLRHERRNRSCQQK
jgi:hypothetical protein